MDGPNATATPAMNQISMQTLQVQAWSYAFQIPIGVIGLITNALAAVLTIIKSKSLHTKYFFALGSLTAAGCIGGIVVTYLAINVTYSSFAGLSQTTTQINCVAMLVPFLWATGLSDYLTLALNIDRLLALATPITYRQKLSKFYVITLNAISWLIPTVMYIFAFYLQNPTSPIPVCTSGYLDKWFQDLYTYMRWIIAALNLLIFTITLIILKIRFNKTKGMGLAERRAARKTLEVHMVKTMGMIVACFVLTKLGGYATITIAMKALIGSTQAQVIALASILPPTYVASHFWLYLIMSKEFRHCFKKLIAMIAG